MYLGYLLYMICIHLEFESTNQVKFGKWSFKDSPPSWPLRVQGMVVQVLVVYKQLIFVSKNRLGEQK